MTIKGDRRMGLYNFKRCFVPLILDGTKRHTIRAPRRHPDRPGAVMHLYTGLRRPGARLLFRAPCAVVQEIALTDDGLLFLDGRVRPGPVCDRLAWEDGFRPGDATEDDPYGAFFAMLRYWREAHVLPFEGHIYHWDYDSREGDR